MIGISYSFDLHWGVLLSKKGPETAPSAGGLCKDRKINLFFSLCTNHDSCTELRERESDVGKYVGLFAGK